MHAFQGATTEKTKYEFTDTRISEADTLLKNRKYQEALEAYQTAFDTYEQESFYEGMVYAKERMGRSNWMLGNTAEREDSWRQAKVLANKHLPTNHILVSKIYFQLGLLNHLFALGAIR